MTHDPITSSTAAKILGCPESTVRYWADRGLLSYETLPSRIRLYSRFDVERLAHERQRQARGETASSVRV